MMKFPTEWANKIHVPNHQPGDIVERPTLPHFYAIIPYMDGFFVGKGGVFSPNNDPYEGHLYVWRGSKPGRPGWWSSKMAS